ncbi:oxygenase MpaB family protein [Dactylosporangium sp. AC04546]|uniref:oxygenase MpaB family protein n=1 Tax=Dactylosporangium sp. AC04546 TaxID=2862460 RepID=UPI001EE11031|nr:oxygenase MpaB family protein [Dactylosporangium sp. AC04546]UFE15764.1 latex clearing protein [Dactylosporangium sp. AC04546]WVK78998.1 oxygenase MpaB family protein [Dactylosporangium sp. AC04546]
MAELSRRKILISGGALGALGALGVATPAWSWSPSGSIAGAGAGADPRWVWDAEADPLVAALIDRGDVPLVNELLWDWNRNDQPLPAGLPADLRDFMEQARQLPTWADRVKLERAAQFNKSRGIYLNLLNGVGGGMLSTAIPKEARAVYYSKGGADMEDRVAKTSILGFAVGALNAYRPDGDCVVQAVKTRLVHAAVRHLLQQSPHWDGTIPISQEDMLVTWHTLPTFAMRRMRDWQVPMTTADTDAYLHVWQVTAHMLGIRDEYIPATWAAANAQSDQVLPRNMGPTPEGVILTDILLGQLAEQTSPGSISRPLVNALARYLVGDQVADWDKIRREPVWGPLISTVWPLLVKFREGLIPLPLVPETAWVIDEAARQYILFYLTKGKETKIVIPTMNRPE